MIRCNIELKFSLFVCLVGFICYFNTLNAGFTYDDNPAIIENEDVKTSSQLNNIWLNDFWGIPLSHHGSHKSYRPICILSFRLNFLLHGLEPRGYHLINILLHCLVCGLFALVAFKLLGDYISSISASLLFAVHPIHTEAVASIVGRADVGSAFFSLLSLNSYLKCIKASQTEHNGTTNITYLLLSNVFCIASALTKEHGVTVAGICLIYDVIFVAGRNCNKLFHQDEAIRKGTVIRVIWIFIVGAIFIYARLSVMNFSTPIFAVADNPASHHPDGMVRFLTFLYLPVVNFSLLIFPWLLCFDWSMDCIPLVTSLKDHRNMYTVVLYSVLIFMMCYFVKIYLKEQKKCFQTSLSVKDNFPQHAINHGFSSQVSKEQKFWKRKLQSWCRKRACSNADAFTQNHFLNRIIESCMKMSYISNNKDPHKSTHRITNNGMSRRTLQFIENTNCCSVADNQKYVFVKNKAPNEDEPHSHDNWHGALPHNTAAAIIVSFSMMFVPFIPATNLLMYVGFVVAERILYIPSMGFCLLVGLGFGRIWSNYRKKRMAITICFLTLLGIFVIRTLHRNMDWKNEESLYRSGLKVNPPKAWGNLGNILSSQGRFAEAETAYRNALKYRPNMADVHYNIGLLLQKLKRYEEAIECYKTAILYRRNFASAYLNLGSAYDEIGNKQMAIEVLRSATDVNDVGLKNPKAHQRALTNIKFNLGKIMFDLKRYKESVDIFHNAIYNMPESYPAYSIYNMLGQAYSLLQDKDSAEKWYKTALSVNQSHIPAQLAYAKHLASVGNSSRAENWFIEAITLQPNKSDSYFHYGQFLLSVGRVRDGLLAVQKSVELNPNEAGLLSFAASLFREYKEYIKAEYYYKKVLILKPREIGSHLNLGALYHLMGRLQEAELMYTNAFQLNPKDELLLTNIRKLQSLRNRAKT